MANIEIGTGTSGQVLTSNGTIPVWATISLQTPAGLVNGSNTVFTFTKAPIIVFRNGVNETRLGTIAALVFTFDTAPLTGDSIEGLA